MALPELRSEMSGPKKESEIKTGEETETPKDVLLADVADAIKAAMPVLDETDQHIATAVHRLMRTRCGDHA